MTSASTSSEGSAGAADAPEVDWAAIERDPEYRRLSRMRLRYIIPVAVVCLGFYLFFLVLAVTASGALGARLFGGFNLAYALMLVVFLLVWFAVFGYVFMANRSWDRQLARVVERAEARQHATPATHGSGESGVAHQPDAEEPR